MVFEEGEELKNAVRCFDGDISVNSGGRVWDLGIIAPGYTGVSRGRCRALLVPGDMEKWGVKADMVITYGMSSKDTVTLSSIDGDECIVAVQRGFDTLNGDTVEPQELPVRRHGLAPEKAAAVTGAAILLGADFI